MVVSNGTQIALAALAGLGLFGGIVLTVPMQRPASEPPPAAAPAATPPAPEAEAEAATPSFDAVRVAPDGQGVVAGQSEPGARVAVMAGEEVAADVRADAQGRFVAFLDLPPSAEPRELTLRGADGGEGAASVILAPTPGAATGVAGAAPASTGPEAAPPTGQAGTAEAATAAGSPVQGATAAAAAQGPVLLSDAEGVRVLQPALPPGAEAEPLSAVALDAITYDGSGDVRLAGRAPAAEGGSVRLYLDNRPVAEVALGPDGSWASPLGGTAPGVYTLRVDQIGPDGEVVSRLETPFQREERGALAAALAEAAGGETIAVRTVQPGNTLWAIARDRYGEPLMYVRVFEMNRDRIRDPDLIYPGQVFVLPETEGL